MRLRDQSGVTKNPVQPRALQVTPGQVTQHAAATETFSVLGTSIAAVQISDVANTIDGWIQGRSAGHYVAVAGMHGVTEALSDSAIASALDDADLVVPDGMPLVWLGKWRGKNLRRRVYGPELMLAVCERSVALGYRHFLYGGKHGVPELLANRLGQLFPGIQVVGTYSPPFRDLTSEEIAQIHQLIKRANPDLVWVGLSTPKQEKWMHQFSHSLGIPVMIGVGAAFDFHTGLARQAPSWMRESGLEWLYRLITEPRRLWRRYILGGLKFVVCVMAELACLKKFGRPPQMPPA